MPESPILGSVVSHYRVSEQLGRGGMGVVYKAHDTRLDRWVALKFLSADSLSETDRLRFVGEAQAAARVHHPNICPIYEIDEHEGQLFFAMALVDGKTIDHLLAREPLPLAAALDIALQVANGLEAAHRLGVIHRDIKTSNVAVDTSGHAWILDFGVALRQDSHRLTAPGGAVGTPAYMSPEQAQGLSVDHRTDIWSLAVILFEMITGQLPFHRGSHYSVLHAIVTEQAADISALRPGVPVRLAQFFEKAFDKDPAQRWQSATEVQTELNQIRATVPEPTRTLTSYVPLVTAPLIPPASKKNRGSLGVLTLIACALLAWGAQRLWFTTKLPDEKRIAVLPFTVPGNDPGVRTLADGLVETLTSKLTQIEEFQGKLMVVPASEIRGRNIASVEDARRIYDANLAITGSAQRWSDRVQFTMNLVDTATIRQLASRTVEFDAANPIGLRDGAVNSAVRLLALKLSKESSTSLVAGETSTQSAYSKYLKGAGYLARYDLTGNVDRAIASFTDATRLDPKYALAYAALGQARWRKAKMDSDPGQAQQARDDIETAIRLDPRLVEARVKLGEIFSESGQVEEAIQQEHQALQMAPDNAEAYRALGQAYAAAHQDAPAENAFREAVQRSPNDWYGHLLLGLFYWNRGRNSDARIAWEAARKLTPDNEVVYRDLANLDLREGKFQQASDLISKTLRFEPGPKTYSTLGIAYYYQKRYEEAAEALGTGIRLDPGEYRNWGNLGTVYRHLPGKDKDARDAFEKAIALASKSLLVMKADYSTQANLAEYWAKLGDKRQAMAAIDKIPEAARGPQIDRIVLAYELTGERKKAVSAVQSLTLDDSMLTYLRNDPDLEALWRDPALSKFH